MKTVKAKKNTLELKTPTRELVQEYVEKFNSSERYRVESQAMTSFCRAFPKNEKLEDILLNVSMVNALYGAKVYSPFEMSKHIQRLQIDTLLQSKDLSVVGKIAAGHGIVHKKTGKEICYYSFATKYCSRYDHETYPVYDKFVHKLLVAYQKKDEFSSFVEGDLKSYEIFVKVASDFRQKYSLTRCSLREIDNFLWLYGKEVFPNG